METWVRLPTKWILNEEENSYLKSMRWNSKGANSHNTASLMVLLAIASNTSHRETRRNPQVGKVELSFTDLTNITSISRKLVSEGLKKLISAGLIEKNTLKKVNQYTLCGDLQSGWGKLPAKKLYDQRVESIKAFKNFKLRSKVELNALKLYFLIVALRDNEANSSLMTYETITKYTAILRNDINPAISLLVSSEMVRVDKIESTKFEKAVVNSYRLVGINPYNHAGTSGKSD